MASCPWEYKYNINNVNNDLDLLDSDLLNQFVNSFNKLCNSEIKYREKKIKLLKNKIDSNNLRNFTILVGLIILNGILILKF